MTNASFLGYIHIFRCFAIGMVVLSHLILSLQWQNQEALHLARMLFSNGTVYFIFIAGYLFQYLLPKYSYGTYLRKKLQFVLLPYFITSLPIILAKLTGKVPDYPAFSERFGQLSAFQKILVYYLTGMHLGPLWFIPMICLFYLVAPVFIFVTKWQKAYLLFPLLILVNLGIPRPWVHDPLISAVHFAPVYLMGMLACRYRDRIYQYCQKLWPVLLSLVVLLCFLEFTSRPFMAFNSVTKVIISFLIIYGLQRREKYASQAFSPWIGTIADYSFGIFFFHQYAIGLYSRAIAPWGHWLKDANILTVAIGFLVVNGACLLLLLGIKKIFMGRSRYIVGC
jgi:probable poly-beta-1,6-N-acetyl-D-glucosamine export protein